MKAQLNWSILSKFRKEMPNNILKIPCLEQRQAIPFICKIVSCGARVLDIGANDKSMSTHLKSKNVTYKSMDIDKTYKHDFYKLSGIKGTYDAVLMIDIIEHLTFEESLQYIRKAYQILKPEGKVIFQLPNIFAIGSNQFYDVTHKQFWPYYDLYSLLRSYGFKKVMVYRLKGRSTKLREAFVFLFCKIFGNHIDYAPNLMMVAIK